jgi:putative peptide zinc metalloprotease protein
VALISAQAAPPRIERAPSSSPEGVLALADSVELIGEFEGSGYRRPPLLVRRGDGQMVQLTRLLYLVAEACDGRRDAQAVAAAVSARYGRRVNARNVLHLAEEQLRPAGVLALADGTTPELHRRVALLALRHRRAILRARAVNVLAAMFSWLHAGPIKAALLAALLLFDAWLFGVHGIAAGLRTVLYEPAWLLAVLVSVVVATAFHEIGHASACRYSGARPGEMGVGLYLVWPAFYCDVTDAYRLNRRGRLRTDLGGVYFNGLFALGCGVAYFLTGHEALLFAAFVQHTIVLQQLLPLLRFDGYYVLSDLTGVPDILSRIKPIFRSLVRGRRREPKVAELKPWVRVVVTVYLVVLVPALALMIASIVLSAPRTFATAYDSMGLQLDRLHGSHGWAELGVGAFRIAALVMPLGAMALSVSRTLTMGLRGIGRWSRGSIVRRAVAFTGAAAVVGSIAFVWWPNGDYQPIRPGERGTVPEVVRAVPEIPSGRPSFTPERAAEFAAQTFAPRSTPTPTADRAEDAGGRRAPGGPAAARAMPPKDGVRDPRPRTPSSIWDDGDWSTAPEGEVPSGVGTNDNGDMSPTQSATPSPPSTAEAITPQPQSSPTPTATPTATDTPAPTPTESAAPTPTETATPSPTPVGMADPTPTAEPADPMLSPTPTPDVP